MALPSYPLKDPKSLDPLLNAIGDAQIVMLGEASHGTSEYYAWRAEISKRLIREKGFSFIAVEGDWPDCYELSRYIKGYSDYNSALEALQTFSRWPTWMWGNWEVKHLLDWLKEYNEQHDKPVRFYGLDVYSLWESLDSVISFLEKNDGTAVDAAKEAFRCFEPFNKDPQKYARSTAMVPEDCEDEVLEMLQKIIQKKQLTSEPEADFNTEQNALVAVNAEKYYRAMIQGSSESWNVRDRHMMDTLRRLTDFHGEGTKAIVWEHNTHIGDARATDMKRAGMYNIGQLAREEYGKEKVFLTGFGSYKGTVIAGSAWGAPMEVMNVPAARSGSWEELLHHDGHQQDLILLSDELRKFDFFEEIIPHRAIGVVYDPAFEKYGNYVPSIIPERYDGFIFIDQTKALHPLKLHSDESKLPELYPWNV